MNKEVMIDFEVLKELIYNAFDSEPTNDRANELIDNIINNIINKSV